MPVAVADELARCEILEDQDPAQGVNLARQLLDDPAIQAVPASQAAAMGCLGWSLVAMGENEQARRVAADLARLARELVVPAESLRFLRRAGGILQASQDRSSAIEIYNEALIRLQGLPLDAELEISQVTPLHVNLGVLYSEFEDHDRARDHYGRALALMAEHNDFRYEAPVRFNLGLMLAGAGEHADALEHLARSVELLAPAGPSPRLLRLRAGYAFTLVTQNQLDAASEQIELARSEVDPATTPPGPLTELLAAEAALRHKQGRAEEALRMLEQADPAWAQADGGNSWAFLRRVHAEVLEATGQYAAALELRKEHFSDRLTTLRLSNRERLAEVEARLINQRTAEELERMRHAREIETLRAAEQRARFSIALLVAGSIVALLATGWWFQRRLSRKLALMSRCDSLTGLLNRRGALEAMALMRATTPRQRVLLALLDIDHFKQVNDLYGHQAGDQVLLEVAQRLRSAVPTRAVVARWGGEEFLLLQPLGGESADVDDLAEALHARLRKPIALTDRSLTISVSIGLLDGTLDELGRTGWDKALAEVDRALYAAKEAGRNRSASARTA